MTCYQTSQTAIYWSSDDSSVIEKKIQDGYLKYDVKYERKYLCFAILLNQRNIFVWIFGWLCQATTSYLCVIKQICLCLTKKQIFLWIFGCLPQAANLFLFQRNIFVFCNFLTQRNTFVWIFGSILSAANLYLCSLKRYICAYQRDIFVLIEGIFMCLSKKYICVYQRNISVDIWLAVAGCKFIRTFVAEHPLLLHQQPVSTDQNLYLPVFT